MKISCIALDDEPLALKLLAEFIGGIDKLDLKATFGSAAEALKYLAAHETDCIFLDVEMPDLNGIELTQVLSNFARRPEIVFVSAYSRYALQGLELEAADFLLKPYSQQELHAAAEKVATLIAARKKQEKEILEPDFFIKIDAQQVRIVPSEIIYVESMRDYVKIYTTGRDVPYIPLMTLKKIKTMLPDASFVQINRSQIVQLSHISSYTRTGVEVGSRRFSVTETFQETFIRAMTF